MSSKTITIIGAGMMGSALSFPLGDNKHHIRLVGTPLDEEIITSVQKTGVHPRLQRTLPATVSAFQYTQIPTALQGADLVISGVSSFGVNWWADTVGPHLDPKIPVIAVTKGLERQPNGDLLILPEATRRRLPSSIRDQINLNAIGGPCTSHELAARRQTCVVFCGPERTKLEWIRSLFATPYYHVTLSTDIVGVEVCAAMKNAYALAVGLAVGMMEKDGKDGLAWAYNPQAALFAQGTLEMRRMLSLLGGDLDNASGLPGAGDLYVTIYGGRTVRLGKLLGQGHPFEEARQILAGETLESVEITNRVGQALPLLEQRGLLKMADFPLLSHIYEILHGAPVSLPWDRFFTETSE